MTAKTLELFFSKLEFAGSGLFSQIRSHIHVHATFGYKGRAILGGFTAEDLTQQHANCTANAKSVANMP